MGFKISRRRTMRPVSYGAVALGAALLLSLTPTLAVPAQADQDCGEALVCAQVAPVEDNQVGPVIDRVFDDFIGELGELF